MTTCTHSTGCEPREGECHGACLVAELREAGMPGLADAFETLQRERDEALARLKELVV